MNEYSKDFFQYLGEIWRDVTAIEFLMRVAITKKDGEENQFPLPPYIQGKKYSQYPKSLVSDKCLRKR